jgi:23S rRNA pseudouridine2605 synthase
LKKNEESPLRLQVFLSHAGIASRRSAEKLIESGRVSVNGEVISVLGAKVLPNDLVCFDGVPIKRETKFHYIALNKPSGYISASFDPQGRALALDLLPKTEERLYNVGRLDFRTSGLLIFSNDGDFSAKLSHPSSEIEKEYVLESTSPIPDSVPRAFSEGISIEDIHYKAKRIERLGEKGLRIVLIEGKNREIRRIFSHFHLHIERLCRVRRENILLDKLKEGE